MKAKKRHIGLKIFVCLLLAAVCAAALLFGRLGATLLTVKCDEEKGIYEISYLEDYKLQQLLDEGGVKTQDELAKYLIRILLKGLPIKIDYDVPSLACSTFVAQTPDSGWIFGRNLDNQETDLAVVRTAPKDGYRSVSVVNLSFLGYDRDHTPKKLKDRIVAMGAPYFPLDGINEKGLAVGVLQLQAEKTDQTRKRPTSTQPLRSGSCLTKQRPWTKPWRCLNSMICTLPRTAATISSLRMQPEEALWSNMSERKWWLLKSRDSSLQQPIFI